MGRLAKYSWKAAKAGFAVTTGAVKGIYGVGDDAKNLIFGNSEILHLQQKLRLRLQQRSNNG